MSPHPYRNSLGHLVHPDDAPACCTYPKDHPIHMRVEPVWHLGDHSFTMAQLDYLHSLCGLAAEWLASDRRAEMIAEESER